MGAELGLSAVKEGLAELDLPSVLMWGVCAGVVVWSALVGCGWAGVTGQVGVGVVGSVGGRWYSRGLWCGAGLFGWCRPLAAGPGIGVVAGILAACVARSTVCR